MTDQSEDGAVAGERFETKLERLIASARRENVDVSGGYAVGDDGEFDVHITEVDR